MLTAAAIIMLCMGLIHSYLGEKYILIRLFRRDNIPKLLGSDEFTKGTLRFCWHITSITWFGIAAILLSQDGQHNFLLYAISLTSLICGVMAAYFTRGKHLSWIAFFGVCALTYLSAS